MNDIITVIGVGTITGASFALFQKYNILLDFVEKTVFYIELNYILGSKRNRLENAVSHVQSYIDKTIFKHIINEKTIIWLIENAVKAITEKIGKTRNLKCFIDKQIEQRILEQFEQAIQESDSVEVKQALKFMENFVVESIHCKGSDD